MTPVTSTTNEGIKITITPLDKDKQPTVVDGLINWEVIDGDCTLQPSEDGSSCSVIGNTAGSTVYQVRAFADADLDAGEERIIDEIFVYTTTLPEAVGFGVATETFVKP